MTIPTEFSNRVYRTRIKAIGGDLKKLDEITKQWPGSEVDILYEGINPTVVLVFDSQEDCLAFTLKYGTNYV